MDMPAEVRTAYVCVVASQSMSDNQFDPQEVSGLYLLMTRLGLDASQRRDVRAAMGPEGPPLMELVERVMSMVDGEDKKALSFSIVKDLILIAQVDEKYDIEEQKNVAAVAKHIYGDEAAKYIKFAEEVVEQDRSMLKGELSEKQIIEYGKKLSATAAALGIPAVAVYFSGSVIGLSAAGITSGLAALGLGGITALGLSSMMTGIGVLVLIGVGTFCVVHYALDIPKRETKAKKEHIVQETLKLHQDAIVALAEDANELAAGQEKLSVLSEQNARIQAELKAGLGVLESALASLGNGESGPCLPETSS